MSEFLQSPYGGFISAAYGITFAVLLAMVLWVVFTARMRRKELAQMEKAGLRRVSSKEAASDE